MPGPRSRERVRQLSRMLVQGHSQHMLREALVDVLLDSEEIEGTKGARLQAPIHDAQAGERRGYKLSSFKRTSSQPSLKGSSFKPSLTRSRIQAPGYKRTFPLSREQATRINVFKLCFT